MKYATKIIPAAQRMYDKWKQPLNFPKEIYLEILILEKQKAYILSYIGNYLRVENELTVKIACKRGR